MDNKILISQASKFPEYCNISSDRFKKAAQTLEPEFLNTDNIGDLIFAPDPKTGIPRSDLAMVLANDARPEVSEYIRQNLMRPLPETERMENPDDALKFSRNVRESLADYGDRLRKMCSDAYDKEYHEKVAREKNKRSKASKTE